MSLNEEHPDHEPLYRSNLDQQLFGCIAPTGPCYYADEDYSEEEIAKFCADTELTREEEQALDNVDHMFFIWKICANHERCNALKCSAKCIRFKPVNGCLGCKHNSTCSIAELCSHWENYEPKE